MPQDWTDLLPVQGDQGAQDWTSLLPGAPEPAPEPEQPGILPQFLRTALTGVGAGLYGIPAAVAGGLGMIGDKMIPGQPRGPITPQDLLQSGLQTFEDYEREYAALSGAIRARPWGAPLGEIPTYAQLGLTPEVVEEAGLPTTQEIKSPAEVALLTAAEMPDLALKVGTGVGVAGAAGLRALIKGPGKAVARDVAEELAEMAVKGAVPTVTGLDEVIPTPSGFTPRPSRSSIIDTRGAGRQFHGSRSAEDLVFAEGHYSPMNYYGPGFYTTDSTRVGFGYTRKSGNLYEVHPKKDLKILDMEDPVPDWLQKIVDDIGVGYEDSRPKNVRELYDEIRLSSRDEGLSADSVQEIFDSLSYTMQQKGYHGMRHRGGLLTKTREHDVVIYFEPEKSIGSIEKLEPRQFTRPPGAVTDIERVAGPEWVQPTVRRPGPAKPLAPVKSVSEEVEARWAASKAPPPPRVKERIKHSLDEFTKGVSRQFPHLSPRNAEDAPAIDILRRLHASRQGARAIASDQVFQVTQNLDPGQLELFTRMAVLPDMIREAGEQGAEYAPGRLFGYQSVDEMTADLARYQALADANPAVKQALEQRGELVGKVTAELVDAGLLDPIHLENPAYYHRMVLSHLPPHRTAKEIKLSGRGGGPLEKKTRSFQKARTGEGGDFLTDYRVAEADWLGQSYDLLARHRAQRELETQYDILPMLKAEAKEEGVDWHELVPDGYTIYEPDPGNTLYPASTVTEARLAKMLEEGATPEAKDFRKALVLGGKRDSMVIPENVATTLHDEGAPKPALKHAEYAWRTAMKAWKQWVLGSPMRILRYNLNNLSGDVDIAFTADPGIFKHFKSSLKDLRRMMGKNRTQADIEELAEMRRLGVLDSGFAPEEVPDLGVDGIRALHDLSPGPAAKVWRKYWKSARSFTTFRENLLRLAAYKRAQQRISEGVPTYWASTPAAVDSITDPAQRAAKVSRELIGDYGAISKGGQYLRNRMIPFYSWMEINAPRYVRLIRNESASAHALGRAGVAATKKLITGSAKLGTRAVTLYGLIQAWNKTMFPEEDRIVNRDEQNLRLILGRTGDGQIRSVRFEGALSDALSWFGMEDALQPGVRDRTPAEVAAEAVKAPVERLAQSWEPISKTLAETLVFRRSAYPRVFERGTSFRPSPRTIYDPVGHAAGSLGLRSMSEALTGKPQRESALLRTIEEGGVGRLPAAVLDSAITNKTDPGEASYFHIRRLQFDFLRKRMKGMVGGFDKNERQLALYYYKRAKRFNDEAAERKWLAEYVKLGGTLRGMKQSIEMSEPLGGMSKKDRISFLRSLTPDDREALALARRWYASEMR